MSIVSREETLAKSPLGKLCGERFKLCTLNNPQTPKNIGSTPNHIFYFLTTKGAFGDFVPMLKIIGKKVYIVHGYHGCHGNWEVDYLEV